jgi:hypothetical protein
MKKILALMLAFIMIFAFVACDSKDDDDDDGSKKALTVNDVLENLENAGYFLELIEDEKTLGYEITAICDGFYPEGALTAIVEAANFETDEFVRVYFFEMASDAADVNDLFEKYEAGGENTGAYKNQGKLFITADTEQGIADALGNKTNSGNGGIGGGIVGGGSAEEESSNTGIGGIGGIGGGVSKTLTLEDMMSNLRNAGFTCEIQTLTDEEYVTRNLTASRESSLLEIVIVGECKSASAAQAEYQKMLREDDGSMSFFTIEIYDKFIFVVTNEELIAVAKGESSGTSNGGSIGGITQQSKISIDSAKYNLEREGYTVQISGDSTGKALTVTTSSGSMLAFFEFLTSADANAYYNEMVGTSSVSVFPVFEIYDNVVIMSTSRELADIAMGK